MHKILVFGAGKSSPALIKYLAQNAFQQQWQVTVADASLQSAQQRIHDFNCCTAVEINISNEAQRIKLINAHDIVISLLPPSLHIAVAKDCVLSKKHLVTASYVSKEMMQLNDDALGSNTLLLNECGLDPGIDHMSAMQIIDKIKSDGSQLISFRSYCGGLIAPESNDNPWGYKFTWNPRNVVLAGQGTACYIENGKYKYIPYGRLFCEIENISVNDMDFEGYANRDSLAYRSDYGIEKIPSLLRGTLRNKGFCRAWNVFVQMGFTDNNVIIKDSHKLSFSEITDALLPASDADTGSKLRKFIAQIAGHHHDDIYHQIIYTDLLNKKATGIENATPAVILQHLLEDKWKLKESDIDMIVMTHRFIYTINGKNVNLHANLVLKGENSVYTAMAKSVGLPLGIAAKNILNGKIKSRGVVIPVTKEIYEPILNELKNYGIDFSETINTE